MFTASTVCERAEKDSKAEAALYGNVINASMETFSLSEETDNKSKTAATKTRWSSELPRGRSSSKVPHAPVIKDNSLSQTNFVDSRTFALYASLAGAIDKSLAPDTFSSFAVCMVINLAKSAIA